MRKAWIGLALALCACEEAVTEPECTPLYEDCAGGVTCDLCAPEGSTAVDAAYYECSDGYRYDPDGIPAANDPGLQQLVYHCYPELRPEPY